jgi:hypothetical protein
MVKNESIYIDEALKKYENHFLFCKLEWVVLLGDMTEPDHPLYIWNHCIQL